MLDEARPRPTPALLAGRKRPVTPAPAPVRQRPGPHMVGPAPLLGSGPAEIVALLGLRVVGDIAAEVTGDPGVWRHLEQPESRADQVGPAWKGCLDYMAVAGAADEFESAVSDSVVAVMLHVHAAFGDPGDRITRSLHDHELGWKWTWREVNLRLAGQLYRHAMLRTRRGQDDVATTALRGALQCWTVVESLSGKDNPDQTRRWRGMRGATQVFFGRRDASPAMLLRGAIADLEISESSGDRTPQHFCMLAEAYLRVFWTTGDLAMLNAVGTVLNRGRASTPDSQELAAATGDLHRTRAMHALVEAGVRVATVAAAEAPATLDGLIDDVDSIDEPLPAEGIDPVDDLPLRAAETAFVTAGMWYSHALTMPPRGRTQPSVVRIRRGQALLRAAHVRRLRGRPYVEAVGSALADLRLCHDETSQICSDYLPWALLEFGKEAVRQKDGARLDDAAAAFEEALGFIRTRVPNAAGMLERALTGLAEVRLRRAVATGEGLRDAMAAALTRPEDSGLAVTPLIYGCRTLLRGTASDSVTGRMVADVVERLESDGRRADGVHRRYVAGHAATLLVLASRVDPSYDVTDASPARIHELYRRAVEGDSAPPPDRLTQLARAAARHARTLIAAGSTDRDRVYALLTEAVIEYRRAAVAATRMWAEHVPARSVDQLDLVVDDSPAVPDEQSLCSMLGDTLLRRDAQRPHHRDLDESITLLERSIELGNISPEVRGLLGDAYFRRGRRRNNLAALLRAFDLKEEARRLTEPGTPLARESWSVSAAIAKHLWDETQNSDWYVAAAQFAAFAASAGPRWAWPWLQAAEIAESPGTTLAGDPPQHESTGVVGDAEAWRHLAAADPAALLLVASSRAVADPEFPKPVLGGMSNVYVIDDPHNLLKSTLVLKPCVWAGSARAERDRTAAFAAWIDAHPVGGWAKAVRPVSITVDPADGHDVLVTRRAAGQPFSAVLSEQILATGGIVYEQVRESAERCLILLAHFHASRGTAGRVRYGALRRGVRDDLRRLGVAGNEALATRWCDSIPEGLAALSKRDAHTDNWLISSRGDVVALDLAASINLPLGFEVAQFLEDMPLLPPDNAGSAERDRLATLYLDVLAKHSPVRVEATDACWRSAYACFAARRALYLLRTSSTKSDQVSVTRVAHARRLLRWSAATVPALTPIADALGTTSSRCG